MLRRNVYILYVKPEDTKNNTDDENEDTEDKTCDSNTQKSETNIDR